MENAVRRALAGRLKAGFGLESEAFISVPGRTELIGNHTDHQRGCVVAAAVTLSLDAAAARTGDGLDKLHALIGELFDAGRIDFDSQAVLLNARQNAAASRAKASIESALEAIKAGLPLDTAGLDLEAALGALGELDARQVGEDVVNAVFSRFCVGK